MGRHPAQHQAYLIGRNSRFGISLCCGVDATYQEALQAAEACRPGLVLADIRLRDGPFTGLEAAHAMPRTAVLASSL
jgi:hypothetical protein